MTEQANGYLLEHNEHELNRLVSYAEREAEEVRMLCRRARVGPGSRVVDLGCGPLGALATFSEVVGDSGTVVGIDASARAIQTAEALANRLGLTNVQLLQADFHNSEALTRRTAASFDFAFCRLVLLHQHDPKSFLARAVELVKPGGFIAVQDVVADPHYPCSEPHVEAQEIGWSLILKLFSTRSLSPDVARDHAQLGEALGCCVTHQRGKFPVLPAQEGLQIVQQLLTASRLHLADAGLSSLDATNQLLADLESAKARTFRYWHGPLAVETLMRK